MAEKLESLERRYQDKQVLQHNTPKLTRLLESHNIEAHLTIFERTMQAHEVDVSISFAPQLTGKAQQAYAALSEDHTRH